MRGVVVQEDIGRFQDEFPSAGHGVSSINRRIHDGQVKLLNGYVSLKPTLTFALDVGKLVTKWGTGYARNPVAFIDRPKNPDDPQEPLEGFYASTRASRELSRVSPALTSIINLRDGSFQLIPEVQYSFTTNLILRGRTIFLVGGRNTEFGEKRNDFRFELRLRYFF